MTEIEAKAVDEEVNEAVAEAVKEGVEVVTDEVAEVPLDSAQTRRPTSTQSEANYCKTSPGEVLLREMCTKQRAYRTRRCQSVTWMRR